MVYGILISNHVYIRFSTTCWILIRWKYSIKILVFIYFFIRTARANCIFKVKKWINLDYWYFIYNIKFICDSIPATSSWADHSTLNRQIVSLQLAIEIILNNLICQTLQRNEYILASLRKNMLVVGYLYLLKVQSWMHVSLCVYMNNNLISIGNEWMGIYLNNNRKMETYTYHFSSFFTDLNYDSTCMWFIPDLDWNFLNVLLLFNNI